MCTRRGAVGISGAPCRGRCPHRPVPRMRLGSGGRLGDPPLQSAVETCRGRCPHRPVRNAALRPTGGHNGRPYTHAFGFFVGAAFMAARNGLRSAEALWESQLSCGCGGNCRGRCPHRPVPRMRLGSGGGMRACRPTGAVEHCGAPCRGAHCASEHLVEIGADLIHQRHGNLVVAPAAVDGQRHLVAG